MRFQYTGPGPLEVQDLTGKIVDLIRPGDVREYDIEPHYGPWECIDPPPEADEGGQPPGTPEASPVALSAAPALNTIPVPPKEF